MATTNARAILKSVRRGQLSKSVISFATSQMPPRGSPEYLHHLSLKSDILDQLGLYSEAYNLLNKPCETLFAELKLAVSHTKLGKPTSGPTPPRILPSGGDGDRRSGAAFILHFLCIAVINLKRRSNTYQHANALSSIVCGHLNFNVMARCPDCTTSRGTSTDNCEI